MPSTVDLGVPFSTVACVSSLVTGSPLRCTAQPSLVGRHLPQSPPAVCLAWSPTRPAQHPSGSLSRGVSLQQDSDSVWTRPLMSRPTLSGWRATPASVVLPAGAPIGQHSNPFWALLQRCSAAGTAVMMTLGLPRGVSLFPTCRPTGMHTTASQHSPTGSFHTACLGLNCSLPRLDLQTALPLPCHTVGCNTRHLTNSSSTHPRQQDADGHRHTDRRTSCTDLGLHPRPGRALLLTLRPAPVYSLRGHAN